MRRFGPLAVLVLPLVCLLLVACESETPRFETELSPLRTELTYLKDAHGRYVHLRGTNVGGSTKVPVFNAIDVPLGKKRGFTYVGRPFAPGEEHKWFAQLKGLGFNAIRLLFIWEAVFPDEKGVPDEEFLDYFENIIRLAGEYGIYVILNMHENLWSRHLWADYNEAISSTCAPDATFCLDDIILPLFPPYTDQVKGDGAPLWATKVCLPEKNFDSPYWGMHHVLGRIKDPVAGVALDKLGKALKEDFGMDVDDLLKKVKEQAPEPFKVTDTTDMLPWTFWGVNNAVSLDVERCYASLFAGDKVYPNHQVVLTKDGRTLVRILNQENPDPNAPVIEDDEIEKTWNLKDYLQESFTEAWVEVTKRAVKYPHVVGYDIMNEPASIFVLLTVAQAYFELGLDGAVGDLLHSLFLDPVNPDKSNTGDDIWTLIGLLEILPPVHMARNGLAGKRTPEDVIREWGFEGADLFAMASLNVGFGRNHLTPLFERVGAAINEVYYDYWGQAFATNRPIIHLEPAFSPDMLLGEGGGGMGGQWQNYQMLPRFEEKYEPVQMVWSPHWYPDIYPYIGFNQKPRQFAAYEYRHRDYTEVLKHKIDVARDTFDNIPTLFGEFGTYWNFRYESCEPPSAANDYNPAYRGPCAYYDADNPRPETDPHVYEGEDFERPGYEQSRYHDYRISAEIMNNYYESFEKLFMSSINWCYTTDNDPHYGDWWNHEDFSIIDENGNPRGELAWVRPYPRALSGKPVSMHFYSDYHYYDPSKGEPNPRREFELVFESKETLAPTIIFVPEIQYPDGFYVWLSDGWIAWNAADQHLYYHPTKDDPKWRHKVVIRPPTPGMDLSGWKYFVKGDQVIAGHGRQ